MAVLGADGGAVCVRDDELGVVRLAATASLAEVVEQEYGTLPLDGPLPGSYTARTGNPVLLPTRRSGLLFAPEMAVVYEGTGRSAWVSLPLRAADRLLGSLVVSWEQERDFSLQDEELLAAFAAQCAQALDRIQVLEAERRAATTARQISETLQRSLLTRPPQPAGLQVAVRYVPASQEAQVGGDWYDAFTTADGVLNLVIGDCTGHDREAVAAMAAVRNLLRATAYAVEGSPAAVLTALDRAMAGLDVTALATALLARVEPVEGGRCRVVWSSAGHLPLVLRRADGATTVLSTTPDLMLGLLPDSERFEHSVELEAGASVLLYTDGMVERRGEDIDEGVERLRSSLTEVGDLPLEQVCDTLLHRLGGDAEDDVALVAVRLG
jgi:serine phosphatase RsbU (regulator of sigma subunit)